MIEWDSNMIVPVILTLDTNAEYTKQNSKAAFVRLREHLRQYAALLKSRSHDPHVMLNTIHKQGDPTISELIRQIIEEVPVIEKHDWDGTLDTLNLPENQTILLCDTSQNAGTTSRVDRIDWRDIDTATSIENLRQQRRITRLKKGDTRLTIWDTYFAPIYSYVPINRIEIIDRYLLTNVIEKQSKQLDNFLESIKQSTSITSKKKSLVIYSSAFDNSDKIPDLARIKTYVESSLLPFCKELSCFSKICVWVCRDKIFRTHYHDRYVISTNKDKIYYVHKLGIGLDPFSEDNLTRSQECSMDVHTLSTIHQYRGLLNDLENTKHCKHEEYIGS